VAFSAPVYTMDGHINSPGPSSKKVKICDKLETHRQDQTNGKESQSDSRNLEAEETGNKVGVREGDAPHSECERDKVVTNILVNQYALIRTIFQYLSMKDLKMCSEVSPLWLKTSNIVQQDRSRFRPASFFWSGDTSNVDYYSNYPLFESPHHVSLHNDMREFSAGLWCEPKMAVIFGTGDIEVSVSEGGPGQEPEDHIQRSFLVDKGGVVSNLGEACTSIATTSRGIVGSVKGQAGYQGVELENISQQATLLTPAVSMMCIPQPLGVKILPFHLAENKLDGIISQIKQEFPYLDDEDVLQEKLLERATGLESGDDLKAVIMLSNGLDLPYSMHIVQAAGRRTNNKVAIGGCVGDLCWSSVKDCSMQSLMREFFYFNHQNEAVPENSYMSTSGFVIAGEKVEAASVILHRGIRSEKKVKAELLKLKNSGICEENSFAFMFACCGRGVNHYRGHQGVEAAVFCQMFPNTPIVGVFGNGEIGINYIPGSAQENKQGSRKAKLQPSQVHHSFTTIIVMISLGKR